MAADVMTFEQYAAKHGASSADIGDSGAHMTASTMSQKQWLRIVRRVDQKSADVVERRQVLRAEFESAKAAGLLREPTRLERLRASASGHPDNESTKAAIRLLAKISDPTRGQADE